MTTTEYKIQNANKTMTKQVIIVNCGCGTLIVEITYSLPKILEHQLPHTPVFKHQLD